MTKFVRPTSIELRGLIASNVQHGSAKGSLPCEVNRAENRAISAIRNRINVLHRPLIHHGPNHLIVLVPLIAALA